MNKSASIDHSPPAGVFMRRWRRVPRVLARARLLVGCGVVCGGLVGLAGTGHGAAPSGVDGANGQSGLATDRVQPTGKPSDGADDRFAHIEKRIKALEHAMREIKSELGRLKRLYADGKANVLDNGDRPTNPPAQSHYTGLGVDATTRAASAGGQDAPIQLYKLSKLYPLPAVPADPAGNGELSAGFSQARENNGALFQHSANHFDESASVGVAGHDIVDQDAVPESVEVSRLNDAPLKAAAAGALYEHSYENLLKRNYDMAEKGFRAFLGQYGSSPLAGNAQYLLGESLYARTDYKRAAQAFLKGYSDYGAHPKAKDSLFKLALSLEKLGQTENACAALAQIARLYPREKKLIGKARQERIRSGC